MTSKNSSPPDFPKHKFRFEEFDGLVNYVDVCVTMPGATNWLQRRLPAKKRLALGKLLF